MWSPEQWSQFKSVLLMYRKSKKFDESGIPAELAVEKILNSLIASDSINQESDVYDEANRVRTVVMAWEPVSVTPHFVGLNISMAIPFGKATVTLSASVDLPIAYNEDGSTMELPQEDLDMLYLLSLKRIMASAEFIATPGEKQQQPAQQPAQQPKPQGQTILGECVMKGTFNNRTVYKIKTPLGSKWNTYGCSVFENVLRQYGINPDAIPMDGMLALNRNVVITPDAKGKDRVTAIL